MNLTRNSNIYVKESLEHLTGVPKEEREDGSKKKKKKKSLFEETVAENFAKLMEDLIHRFKKPCKSNVS